MCNLCDMNLVCITMDMHARNCPEPQMFEVERKLKKERNMTNIYTKNKNYF
jgi:hypothetical protein